MRRRDFITILGGASAALPFAAVAQQAGRTYRLGVLLPLTHDAPVNVAFLDEFRRWGFIEGQNLTVEWRAYGLNYDLISQYAAELIKARVDVITVGGDDAIRAAQQATKTIPIVAATDDMLRKLRQLGGAAGRQFNGRQFPNPTDGRQATGHTDRSGAGTSPNGRACRCQLRPAA